MNSAPVRADASICFASGAMNKLTSIPASRIFLQVSVKAFSPPTTSRPPSVVTSWRRSGTRQTISGFNFSASATISGVLAISKFNRVLTTSRNFQMSRSCMCRRSSRRCAVMPCAPATSLMRAASTGSGSPAACPRYRASRIVATWSMLTPSLSIMNKGHASLPKRAGFGKWNKRPATVGVPLSFLPVVARASRPCVSVSAKPGLSN